MRAFIISLALLAASTSLAQTPAPAPASDVFILHKFAKSIGKETDITQRDGDRRTVTADFLFTDRGSPVPLKASYTATAAGEPVSLTLDGRASRLSPIKDSLLLDAATRQVKLLRADKTATYPADSTTFLIDGYSPVFMQGELMRFWLAHGRPAQINTPPNGAVHIQPAGDLTITAGSAPITLHGYVVNGLIWGSETLWLDDAQQLAALVSTDAEFDHFEAVRETYEASLGVFIQAAAKNQLAALAQLAAKAKQAPPKHLLIRNVTLIDGTGSAPQPNASVLVENGHIIRIFHGGATMPKDTTVLDGTGKYLIPGLWDMHAHYEQVEWGPIYLAAGVTTVRDCGNEFDFITTVRDTLDTGKGIGPRLLMAGIVDGPGPHSLGAITASTPEEAIAVVQKYKAAGAVQIKIYSSMSPELVPVITREAHRLGMTVTGHVPTNMTAVQAVEAGYDGINHISYAAQQFLPPGAGRNGPVPLIDFDKAENKQAIELFKQHNTVWDDTITLSEAQYHPASTKYETLEPGYTHVAPQLAAALDFPGLSAANQERYGNLYPDLLATIRKLHEAGLPIVAGTDQNIPGYSLHRELEIYVEGAGFTPMQALQAATLVPARVMKLDKELGTIETGKRADMVLLEANPLADIHNTRKIAKTISGGAVYDPAPLWTSVEFKP